MVRYEDLRAHTGVWLAHVAALLDADFDEREIRDAIEYTSFGNMRRLEAAGHFRRGGMGLGRTADPNALKTRRGKIGGYRDYFEEEQLAELEALVAERLSPTLGYTEPRPSAPSIRSSQRVV